MKVLEKIPWAPRIMPRMKKPGEYILRKVGRFMRALNASSRRDLTWGFVSY